MDHGCVISKVQLYYPEGMAYPNRNGNENTAQKIEPKPVAPQPPYKQPVYKPEEPMNHVLISAQDIYELEQCLKESEQRKSKVENQLQYLTQQIQNLTQRSDYGWKSSVSEMDLLLKVDSLNATVNTLKNGRGDGNEGVNDEKLEEMRLHCQQFEQETTKQLQDLTTQVTELESALKVAKREVETKTSELKILDDRLENDNQSLLAHNKSLETDYKSVQEKLTQADKEHETLLEKYKTSEQTTENYKVQLKRNENDIKNLNFNLDKYRTDLESKEKRMDHLEGENKKAISDKIAALHEVNKLQVECVDLKKIHFEELTQIRTDHEERIDYEIEKRRKQLATTLSIFTNIVGESNDIPEKKSESTEEFLNQVLQPWIHSKIKELKRSIECSTREKISLENQKSSRDFGSQSEEIDEQTEKDSIASQEPLVLDDPFSAKAEDAEIDELKARIIQFEKDNKLDIGRIADLENYKKSSESSITELEKQNQVLAAKLSQKDEAIDSLELKLKKSETNCLSASRIKDESNIRIEKLKKHNSSIKSNLENKETEISALKEKIKCLDDLRSKDLNKYSSELEKLKKDLAKKNSELTSANTNSKMVAFACFTIFLVVIVVGDFWFNGESPSSWLSFSKVSRFFKSA